MNPDYLKECDIDTALRSIGFREVSDCLNWKWKELDISVGLWSGNERLMLVQRIAERSLTDYQRLLPATGIKGWYIGEIYKIWRDEFPTEAVPSNLIPGHDYLEYQKVVRSLIPKLPSISIDRAWMRVLIRQLRQLMKEIEVDPEISFPIHLHYDQGQMMLDVEERCLSVPASGLWLGSVTFDVRDFLHATRRFARDPVIVSYADGRITIANSSIQASWNDIESIPDNS